jgi:hypothetical protein
MFVSVFELVCFRTLRLMTDDSYKNMDTCGTTKPVCNDCRPWLWQEGPLRVTAKVPGSPPRATTSVCSGGGLKCARACISAPHRS